MRPAGTAPGFARSRSRAPEKMDDPGADPVKLINTVRQFRLINYLFSSSRRLIRRHFISRMSPAAAKPYRVLDIGAGGCDTMIWLAGYCRDHRIPVGITCMDVDPRIAAYARQRTAEWENIRVVQLSAFDMAEAGRFDFVFSNHLLHHMDEDEIAALLELLCESAGTAFLMNDLRRSLWSYLGYRLFASLFLHRSFARYDGSLSILRGFTPGELQRVIARCSCAGRMRQMSAAPGRLYILGAGGGIPASEGGAKA